MLASPPGYIKADVTTNSGSGSDGGSDSGAVAMSATTTTTTTMSDPGKKGGKRHASECLAYLASRFEAGGGQCFLCVKRCSASFHQHTVVATIYKCQPVGFLYFDSRFQFLHFLQYVLRWVRRVHRRAEATACGRGVGACGGAIETQQQQRLVKTRPSRHHHHQVGTSTEVGDPGTYVCVHVHVHALVDHHAN